MEQGGAEQSRAELSRAEQSRAEQSRTEQSRAEQNRTEQSSIEQNSIHSPTPLPARQASANAACPCGYEEDWGWWRERACLLSMVILDAVAQREAAYLREARSAAEPSPVPLLPLSTLLLESGPGAQAAAATAAGGRWSRRGKSNGSGGSSGGSNNNKRRGARPGRSARAASWAGAAVAVASTSQPGAAGLGGSTTQPAAAAGAAATTAAPTATGTGATAGNDVSALGPHRTTTDAWECPLVVVCRYSQYLHDARISLLAVRILHRASTGGGGTVSAAKLLSALSAAGAKGGDSDDGDSAAVAAVAAAAAAAAAAGTGVATARATATAARLSAAAGAGAGASFAVRGLIEGLSWRLRSSAPPDASPPPLSSRAAAAAALRVDGLGDLEALLDGSSSAGVSSSSAGAAAAAEAAADVDLEVGAAAWLVGSGDRGGDATTPSPATTTADGYADSFLGGEESREHREARVCSVVRAAVLQLLLSNLLPPHLAAPGAGATAEAVAAAAAAVAGTGAPNIAHVLLGVPFARPGAGAGGELCDEKQGQKE